MLDDILYPPIEPHDVFGLDVGHGHRLHVELCGNPQGRPVVVVHGGPGAGCSSEHRRFFDPRAFRIIVFDQRGAGRSTPLGSIDRNTTPDLIADLDRIRQRLDIGRWMLFGGSWGSTLSLAYAAEHRDRVAAMVLRGTWLARREDVDWHMTGLRSLAPDRWEDFAEPIALHERGDMLEAYWQRLSDAEPGVRTRAARAWCAFEQHFTRMFPGANPTAKPDAELEALARIEAHYFRHGCFVDPEALIAGATRLGDIPGAIVHGRYDWLARLEGAWKLSKAWPAASLEIVPDAAHSVFEPGIAARLVAATDRFAQLPPWN
jgi:proline iminopeptidase